MSRDPTRGSGRSCTGKSTSTRSEAAASPEWSARSSFTDAIVNRAAGNSEQLRGAFKRYATADVGFKRGC